jgi:hypothetical protein
MDSKLNVRVLDGRGNLTSDHLNCDVAHMRKETPPLDGRWAGQLALEHAHVHNPLGDGAGCLCSHWTRDGRIGIIDVGHVEPGAEEHKDPGALSYVLFSALILGGGPRAAELEALDGVERAVDEACPQWRSDYLCQGFKNLPPRPLLLMFSWELPTLRDPDVTQTILLKGEASTQQVHDAIMQRGRHIAASLSAAATALNLVTAVALEFLDRLPPE